MFLYHWLTYLPTLIPFPTEVLLRAWMPNFQNNLLIEVFVGVPYTFVSYKSLFSPSQSLYHQKYTDTCIVHR